MKKEHIALQRLKNQLIQSPPFAKAEEVVHWLGAVQAQDYEMAKWAVGVRTHGNATNETLEKALTEGKILRTHILRPTWHLVDAKDIYWMLELTAPHVKRAAMYMNKQLGLDAPLLKKSNNIIVNALEKHEYLSREAIMEHLMQAQIDASTLRSAHFMFHAEQEGLVCSGPTLGKQQTYALLENRVPKHTAIHFTRDEALAALAARYFTSHGPATIKDFMWWSGLGMTDAKRGIEGSKEDLEHTHIGDTSFWHGPLTGNTRYKRDTVEVLPAYDEFMVAYTDRSASLAQAYAKNTISGNGIFKPIIVLDGQVVGIWKRTSKPKQMLIEFGFFEKQKEEFRHEVQTRFKNYETFVGKQAAFGSLEFTVSSSQ